MELQDHRTYILTDKPAVEILPCSSCILCSCATLAMEEMMQHQRLCTIECIIKFIFIYIETGVGKA